MRPTLLALCLLAVCAGCEKPAQKPLPPQFLQSDVQPPKPAPAPEPATAFFGAAAPARRIAYVIDRSGSMTDSIMYVKYELRRSIRRLRPTDEFYVVFYSSGPPVEMPPRKLVPATDDNKQAACDFIDRIVPVGQTDPADALKRAFAVGPDTIYLLTDGEFARSVVGLIDRLNAARKVSVNTICFIYSTGEPLMQEIAEKNGGAYKFVGEKDLENLGK